MKQRKANDEKPLPASDTAETDAQRLKDYALLISGLTHELRNPLGSIVGGASVLDQYAEKLDGPAKSRICAGIMQQTRRLDSLFTALGALARARTGTLIENPQRVELNELLRGLWAVDPNSGGSAGATSLLREEVFLETDPAVFRTILSLLLGLTAIFAPDDGSAELSLALEGETAVMTVKRVARDDERVRLQKLLEERQIDHIRSGARSDSICLAAIREVVHSLGGQYDIQYDEAGGHLLQTVRLNTVSFSAGLDGS